MIIDFMRISRNRDGIPVEVLIRGLSDEVSMLVPVEALVPGLPDEVSIMEIPVEVLVCGLPDEVSSGLPDEVSIWLRVFRLASWQGVKEFVWFGLVCCIVEY